MCVKKKTQNNVSVSHHWNWLRQIQLTRIKILNLTISVRLSLAPLLPPAFTPSSVLSVHKHKLNLLLMIALLTRRGSIHSRRPATTTGQISWRERGRTKKKTKKQNSEEASDGEALGEDLSYIYSGLNNALD